MKSILVGYTVLSLMVFAGCDNKPSSAGGKSADAAKKDGHSDADGHDHSKDAAHGKDDGHDHSEHDAHGHDESKGESLGSIKIGAFKVTVAQEATVTAGKEGSFHVKIIGGNVKTVSTWIGTQDGKGSVKAKAEKEGADFHAHPQAPASMPSGSMLWIELEADDGTKLVGSIAYR